MRSNFFGLALAIVATPFVLAGGLAAGCGGGGGSTGPTAPSSSQSAKKPDAALTAPPPDAATMSADAHHADVSDGGDIWAPVLAQADAATDTTDAGPPPPCWKGFTPTGNAETDVVELGHRCAQGMSQLIPPVKHTFKQGESKSIPVAIVPGCYRVIAVGGKGVKDVDLALRDQAGNVVAADMTPNDIFPMIHPNKEFCAQAVQFLNLTISVKKGAGDVAGGVWKR